MSYQILSEDRGVFANILLDKWFKRAFKEYGNAKRLMLLFLQALIPEREIVSIDYASEESTNQNPDGKNIRVDVECYDKQGRRFVVEVPKCRLRSEASLVEKLGYALGNLSSLEEKPTELEGEIFDLLFSSADLSKFTPEDKIKYQNDVTTDRDIRNQLVFARDKGLEEGKAHGIVQSKNEIARAMLSKGFDTATIMELTGLTAEEIETLKAE